MSWAISKPADQFVYAENTCFDDYVMVLYLKRIIKTQTISGQPYKETHLACFQFWISVRDGSLILRVIWKWKRISADLLQHEILWAHVWCKYSEGLRPVIVENYEPICRLCGINWKSIRKMANCEFYISFKAVVVYFFVVFKYLFIILINEKQILFI